MCGCDHSKARPGGMNRPQFIRNVIAAGAVSFSEPLLAG